MTTAEEQGAFFGGRESRSEDEESADRISSSRNPKNVVRNAVGEFPEGARVSTV